MSVESSDGGDDRPARPETLALNAGSIPDALQERDQWVCWRYEFKEDRGEWSKVPYNAKTGDYASSTGSETWATLDTAREYHRREDTDGIGFVVSDGNLVVGVDLDDCRDPDTGEIDAWARAVVDAIPTYAEVSPSGTGLRLFGFGFVPDGGHRADVDGAEGHIEMYDTSRYLTFTGHRVEDAPTEVRQVNDEIASVHRERIATDDDPTTDTVAERPATNLDDEQLLDMARDAKNGDNFEALYDRGSTARHPSHSEADAALCQMLAFWTGGDARQMNRLFRNSALMRPKWDEDRGTQTYGERTIEQAIRNQTEFYFPGSVDGSSSTSTAPTMGAEEASTDGGAAVDDTSPPRTDFKKPTAQNVMLQAGLDLEEDDLTDLNDRERAYFTVQLLAECDDYHVLAAQPDGTIYRYDNGVWTDTGEQLLREVGHDALGTTYGANTLTEMQEHVRATTPVPREQLGTPPGTVAVANGLLDLNERNIEELRPEHYALTQLPVEYDPDATADRWREFVGEVVEEDMRDAVQEYVGYSLLTGSLPIHRALMLVGEGSNGKSTFLRVVKALLGEENITAHSLQNLSHSQHAVADLFGTVANVNSDLSSRGLGDGGMFKTLLGGDTVTGEKKYQDPFSFRATAKHLYAANQVPDTNIDDEAFFRRWLIVEFPTQFTASGEDGPDKDPGLTDKLLDELPGVLNWALDGYQRLMEQGHFTNEGDALEKRDRWLTWDDSISKFVDDGIDTGTNGKHRTADVHARYAAWCREVLGEEPQAQQTLTKELKQLEGVEYGNFRFGGSRGRGLKGFGFTDEVPESDTGSDPEDVSQSSLNQHGTNRKSVFGAVRDLEGDNGTSRDELLDHLNLDAEDVNHHLSKLKRSGDIQELDPDHFETT